MRNSDGSISRLCPVQSYENYVNLLDKGVEYLWQRPKPKIPKSPADTWYIKKQVGHNTHEKFLSKLSEKAELSQHYTNHCICVTGVMDLRRANFTAKQVMSVSRHKSIESLAIYEKIHEDKKLMMGLCLTYSLINPHNARRVQPANIEPLQLQTPKKQIIENATTKPTEVQLYHFSLLSHPTHHLKTRSQTLTLI